MMKSLSLQMRITMGLAASLAVIFSLQWWMAGANARAVVENIIVKNLDHEMESILSAVQIRNDGELELLDPENRILYQRVYSGHYFIIRTGKRELSSRSLWDERIPPLENGISRVAGPRGQALFAKTDTFIKSGATVRITVAENVKEIDEEISAFKSRFAGVAVVTLVVLLVLQVIIVRVALVPVKRARLGALRVETGEADRIDPEVPKELAPFVAQINRLADLMRKRLTRSRTTLGDLAHSLKTPLTVLGQVAETDTVRSDPELGRVIEDATGKMTRLIDKELRKARLAGGQGAGRPFDTDKDLPLLIKTLNILYHGKGVDTMVSASGGTLATCDCEDMTELLGTLLDNAYKWARQRVSLTIAAGERVAIMVEDDGPGCPADLLESISRRGVRQDESVPGNGLGLGIARDIVDSYGGAISFSRSKKLGGLKVEVTLKNG